MAISMDYSRPYLFRVYWWCHLNNGDWHHWILALRSLKKRNWRWNHIRLRNSPMSTSGICSYSVSSGICHTHLSEYNGEWINIVLEAISATISSLSSLWWKLLLGQGVIPIDILCLQEVEYRAGKSDLLCTLLATCFPVITQTVKQSSPLGRTLVA